MELKGNMRQRERQRAIDRVKRERQGEKQRECDRQRYIDISH